MGARDRVAAGAETTSSRFPVKAAETLSGNRVITFDEIERFNGFIFDPNGASRNVDLPAEAACADSLVYIKNTGVATEIITVRNDAGGTVVTIDGTEGCLVFCDGTNWEGFIGIETT